MSLDLLFLGTGTSAGVPMIGCGCEVCRSTNPRDSRTRPSVLICYADPTTSTAADQPPHATSPIPGPVTTSGVARFAAAPQPGTQSPALRISPATTERRLLIDTGPDMRLQMIRHGIDRIDGVLYTHAHADHIFGLDDLRRFNVVMGGPIDMYVDPPTRRTFQNMFRYIFEPESNVNQSWVPQLVLHAIDAGQPLELFGARWTPLRLMHGNQPVLGFRVDLPGTSGGSLAYCTDVSAIPDETFPLLEGLDILVIDGLRYRPHPTHLSVDQAIGMIQRIKPGRAYLTHIAHDIQYADLEPRLPEGVHLSYDGLRVSCADTRQAHA